LDAALKEALAGYKARFIEAMDDDLNTAGALAALFDLVTEVNTTLAEAPSKAAAEAAAVLFDEITDVLGILYNRKEQSIDAEIEALIAQRQQARKDKNFALADQIRDELKAQGILLEDTPQGVKWKREG
jgi:cysteinyl-tRNA synthetase